MSITVYGASDDLIEVEGEIEEEFNYRDSGEEDEGGDLLAFENGIVLRVRYTWGVWRITPVAGPDAVTVVQAPEGDESNYSDRATLPTALWVVHGSSIGLRG